MISKEGLERIMYWRHLYHRIKKYLFCIWAHRKYRCYPQSPEYWHCVKCFDCDRHDGFDLIFPGPEDE